MSAPGNQMSQRFNPRRPQGQRFGIGLPGMEPPGGNQTMEFNPNRQPQGGGQRMFSQMSGGQIQGQPQIQGQSSNRPSAMGNDAVIGRGDIDPYLGKAGNVKYDPYSGKTIKRDQRVNPMEYALKDLSQYGTDEARNFQYEDLPASPTQAGGAIDRLGSASDNLLGRGMQDVQGGLDQLGGAAQNILGTQGRNLGQFSTEQATRANSLQQLQELQRQALSPNLSPEQRQFYQQRADERRAEVQGLEGNLMDAFQRQGASNAAQLAARGVTDSTTGSNTQAELQRRLGLDLNTLNQQANETSRGEQLAGQEANRAAATQFGGIQSNQASQTGDMISNLLNQQLGAGTAAGQLGLGQAGIGAELSKLGIGGLGSAGELGIAGRGQEADLQQSEMLTRLMGNQTNLNNIQSYLNNKLNRRVTKAELQNLLNPPKTGGGLWSGLLGAAGGIAGGLVGGPAGAAAGSQLGRAV